MTSYTEQQAARAKALKRAAGVGRWRSEVGWRKVAGDQYRAEQARRRKS
jgi:hypothetical protein